MKLEQENREKYYMENLRVSSSIDESVAVIHFSAELTKLRAEVLTKDQDLYDFYTKLKEVFVQF